MVKIDDIRDSNDRYASQKHQGLVCVFMGATMGIGMGTLRKLVTMVQSSTFYVIGRSETKFADELARLRASAPSCEIVFVEEQISLISGVDAASKKITAAAQKVDILCMSPGGMPFQGAVYTEEGLEQCFTISYYSRLRLVSNLMPLLVRSPHPRILSILNGTLEKRIDENDLGLEKQWAIRAVVNQSTICTSLAFDHLAAKDDQKKLTLIHATPGFVNTGTPRTTYPSTKDGYLWWAFLSIVQIVSGWIINKTGFALTESGERHAFHLTSDTFAPGSWQTNRFNDIKPANDALAYYQEHGWADKVWEHTLRVWDKALNKKSP